MNTIKKTTLIAVITAMAAIAVPSMASAATWAPLNTNKTLTAVGPVAYVTAQLSASCTSSTLGVHVRTPASSTIDITSASFSGCTATASSSPCGAATITATGLPWAATTSGSSVTFTEHLLVTYGCAAGATFNIDGPVGGNTYNNTTHTFSVHPQSPMYLWLGHDIWGQISSGTNHTWHETTNTLTLT